MTIDHIPNRIREFTYEMSGYVTAAEGFVFLSGYVAGMKYSSIATELGDLYVRNRAWRRAGEIYFYHVITLLLLLITFGKLIGPDDWSWHTWYSLSHQTPARALAMTLSLVYQPQYLDILPMYCVFLLLTPFVLKQLRNGRTSRIIAASSLIWLFSQFGLRDVLASVIPASWGINLGEFNAFAWQLPFVIGLYFGVLRASHTGSPLIVPMPILFICWLFETIVFAISHGIIQNPALHNLLNQYSHKKTLGIIRIINAAALAGLLVCLRGRMKNNILVIGLAYLGRHSLQVFTFQTVISCFVGLSVERYFIGDNSLWCDLVSLLCVAALYLPAWLCERRAK